MGEFDHVFGGVQDAQRMGQRTPRLPDGTYEVLLESYGPVPSKTNNGNRIEADFMVLQSTNANVQPGATLGWAWFPDTNGWAGVYEKDRAREFIEGSGVALSLQEEVKVLGARLSAGQLRGLKVRVTVSPQYAKDGSRKVGKSGPYSNASWAIPPQTREELAQNAALVEQKKGPLKARIQPAMQAQGPQQMQMQAQAPQQMNHAAPTTFGGQTAPFPGVAQQSTTFAPAGNPFVPATSPASNPFQSFAAPTYPTAPQAGNPFAPGGAGPNPLAAITGGLKPF